MFCKIAMLCANTGFMTIDQRWLRFALSDASASKDWSESDASTSASWLLHVCKLASPLTRRRLSCRASGVCSARAGQRPFCASGQFGSALNCLCYSVLLQLLADSVSVEETVVFDVV